jgi:acyl dehydratase
MSETDFQQGPAAQAIAPIRTGEHFGRKLRYSVAQIVEFARISGDTNPLHLDSGAAHASKFKGPIASGQQSAAMLMGLVASHFSRSDDGVPREALCLNFNFAFKAPIQAETDIDMRWVVSAVEFNARLGGWIGSLNGSAFSGGTDCVVARGTVLVKHAGGRP